MIFTLRIYCHVSVIFSQYVVRVFWSLTPAPPAASQDSAQPKKRALAEGLRRASDRGAALGEALRRAQGDAALGAPRPAPRPAPGSSRPATAQRRVRSHGRCQ